jgi:uncharacterized protein (TIGR02145 family)
MTYEKRIVAGLRKYAKYLSLLALAICACTHTPENCGDGGDQLDPNRQFCRDGKALNKCGGKEYDPYAQFCATEKVYGKCNGKDAYDPLREFCSGNRVIAKCGGSGDGGAEYNPETQGCVSGIVKQRCGNNFFDPNNEFCFNEIRIYDLCKGHAFDPAAEGCNGEAVLPKCGANHYNPETHFCDNNVTYAKCNGNEYAPAKAFCHGGAIYSKCGEQVYDPSRQTCNGTTLVDIVGPPKCGGVEYDGAASFCYNDKDIIPKCGGQAYDPTVKTCNGGNIVDIPQYTVYFNANGGTDGVDPPKTVVADSGKGITLPGQQTMSKDGFDFGGWNTNNAGTGTNYSEGDFYTVTGNVILYAMWWYVKTEVIPEGSGSISIRYISQTRATITATAASGYRFARWSGLSTSTSATDTITVSGNSTLTAIFFQGGMFTDDRNGKTYKTVRIGNQWWMAENLNYQVDGSWCYGNDNSNCATYGRLYQRSATRTACPSGWHLPSRAEWNALETAVGGSSTAGKHLKSTSGWNSSGNGTDAFTFSALPGGSGTNGSFHDAGDYGNWWTATEEWGGAVWYRYMSYNRDDLPEFFNDGGGGLSVRCVGD